MYSVLDTFWENAKLILDKEDGYVKQIDGYYYLIYINADDDDFPNDTIHQLYSDPGDDRDEAVEYLDNIKAN